MWPCPSSALLWLGRERDAFPPLYSPLTTCGRWKSWAWWVIRAGELSLPLTRSNAWESRPCTSLGQHSRASSGGAGVVEPTLSVWKQENCSLLQGVNWPKQCWWGLGRTAWLTNPVASQVRTRIISCLIPTSTLSMICRRRWRGYSCTPKDSGPSWYRATTGYPRGVPVRAQHR